MAGPSTPPKARAVAGLAWAVRGLVGFLVLQVATAVGLLVLIPAYGLPDPTTFQIAGLKDSLLVLSGLLLLVGIASGLLYCVGLAGLHGGRRDLGPEHTESVEQAVPWLGVTLILLGTSVFVPSLTGPLITFPGVGYVPPAWSWSIGVVLAGLRAIFAGLTLYYAVQGLAEEDERFRLLVAMTLGVAGAVVWSGLAAYASAATVPSMDSLLPFVTGIVAGLGTAAISLALFVAVYREIRRGLQDTTAASA